MSSRYILLISSISYFLAVGFGGGTSMVGGAFAVLGLITLLIGIIRLIRERKQEKKQGKKA